MSICLTDGAVTNVYSEGNETGTGLSVEHEFQNPIYGPGQELESNPSIRGHPQTQPQILPPHVAALYDTANYPNKPTRQHDYAETADFIGLPSDSSNSVRPRPYDYVDTPLDSEGGTSSGPPAVDPQVRAVYTKTDHP